MFVGDSIVRKTNRGGEEERAKVFVGGSIVRKTDRGGEEESEGVCGGFDS